MQQEAARKLRFTAKKTMTLAQRLYEGIELGDEGAVGLITYMRTDSTRLSDDAVAEARAYIGERYGKEYLPDEPVVYKTQEVGAGRARGDPPHVDAVRSGDGQAPAHRGRRRQPGEAARRRGSRPPLPADLEPLHRLPDEAGDLRPDGGRHHRRPLRPARQRPGAEVPRLHARSTPTAPRRPGETRRGRGDRTLPPVTEGETLTLHKIDPEQHFTQPPPRFSEASLVKELEEKGIGRPSTYANILSTIQDRGYVEKKEGRFHPTTLGTKVNDLLVESFPDILDVTFTASMEEGLDGVEEGQRDWVKLLGDFYTPFKVDLDKAEVHMRDVKREEIPTDFKCEKCGTPMVIKWGRNGEFLACSGYPECKNTKEFLRKEDGTIEIAPEATTDEKCETCGAPMVVKRGRFGEFLACSRYPDCKTTRPISLGVTCPRPSCGGFLTEKRSRRGKVFFGCSNYAKTGCDFVSWDRPMPQTCPQCEAPFLVKRENRRGGGRMRCIADGCGYSEKPPESGEGGGEGGAASDR